MDKDIIIYIGGFELPDKNAAAHRVLNNAKLLSIDYRIIFIGIDKELDYKSGILRTETTIQGFTSYSVPYPKEKVNWIDYLCNVNEYIKVIENYHNVVAVIMYNFQSIAMLKLMYYCKGRKIKCYADVTEWRSAKGENFTYRLLKDSDTWFRMTILHKKMDGLIVISKFLKEYYSTIQNIVLIPALTDLKDKKWINTYEKSNECLYMVYGGCPGLKDKLDVLVEAVTYTKRKCHLDIIGLTYREYLEIKPQHFYILQNNPRINFIGRISHMEVLEYVKRANYSCFFREDSRVSNAGFPTKLAEAISCGTPVLTNKTSDIYQYLDGVKNGVCLDSIEVSRIIDAIENLPFSLHVERNTFDYGFYSFEIKKLKF